MLAWRGGVPALHLQAAPSFRPTRLHLLCGGLSGLTSLELLSAPMPSLAAVYIYSRLNVPLLVSWQLCTFMFAFLGVFECLPGP